MRRAARPGRGGRRGAMALMMVVASVFTGAAGMVATCLVAVGVAAGRAQTAADTAAHDAEVDLLRFPVWERDDLSVRLQADPSPCAMQGAPDPQAAEPLDLCAFVFAQTAFELGAQPELHAALLELIVEPDRRDTLGGKGPGRLEVIATAAVERHLPGCANLSRPQPREVSVCWAQATAAAHDT